MKYMRKTPVEAIQWTGGNDVQVLAFISRKEKIKSSYSLKDTELRISYTKKCDKYTYNVAIPILGWVVRERDELSFYKDATFRKTFEAVADVSKGFDWEGTIKTIKYVRTIRDDFEYFDKVLKGCKGVFREEPSKKASGVLSTMVRLNNKGRMAKLIYDLYKGDEKTREEIKKNLSEGLKDMEGSDTYKATFESVLDEMKELHAKKDADYGDAAHVNFLKYGPVASLSRLSEKMQRAEHILLSGKCEVKDEPLTETLIDIAITSAMLYMELKNKGNG